MRVKFIGLDTYGLTEGISHLFAALGPRLKYTSFRVATVESAVKVIVVDQAAPRRTIPNMNAPNLPVGANSIQALNLLETLASSAWDWLGAARRLRLGFSEDTISDLTSLEIARRASPEIAAKRVSKYKERFVGFDWLWIVNRSRGRHAIYVIQAKKLKIDRSTTFTYGRVRYPSNPPYQIDALEQFANHIGAIPLYCLYNNVAAMPIGRYWHCKREGPSPPQMGFTLVPIDTARLVHDSEIPNRFRPIHCRPEAIPWRCLFHPECTAFNLYSVSEGSLDMNEQPRGALRRAEVAEYLTESIFEGNDVIDFDDFVRRFDLDSIVERYAEGGFRAMIERGASFRLDD